MKNTLIAFIALAALCSYAKPLKLEVPRSQLTGTPVPIKIENLEPKAPNPEPDVPEADNNAAENLIAEGISFMEKMLDVLGNEDSARRLVDSMVSTDSKTGRTTVNIPVKNKETVVKFVSLIGNIVRNFKK